jgi:alpha-glucosidase
VSARHHWWQRGIVYEIYIRSFADANADGVGDLQGIGSRLDYLSWLGVDAIWITPFFPSPMVDGGYDVADYTGVEPIFGSLDDFDRLLADAHARSLKVILDLVPNHTSDRHPWFVDSRRSREAAKRDWYLWRDPGADGGPPNNWISEFGGSAWEWDEATQQFYYHAFAAAQPDLNWRNPDVRRAVFDAMRFWLDRGVDGFRVDVMWHMVKDEHFRDDPPNPQYREGMAEYRKLVHAYSVDQPEVHDVVADMRTVLEEYNDRLLIGEIYLPVERLIDYYGLHGRGAQLPFNFHLISAPWDARQIEVVIDRYEGALPDDAWPNWVLGNHDKPRVASRIGDAQARVAAVLLLTLRGTPTLYYGEELGLRDAQIPPGRVVDVREESEPGRGLGRDPERTPMPWNGEEAGGFSDGTPWLPLGDENLARNVERQRDDEASMLALHRRLIELRRREPALSVGGYRPVMASGNVLAFRRDHLERELLVALNLGGTPARLALPADFAAGRVLLSATNTAEGKAYRHELELAGNEALILGPIGKFAGGAEHHTTASGAESSSARHDADRPR